MKGNVFLTEHGRDQARELADFFDKEQIPLDLIISSPYHRALETVKLISERKELKILVEPGFQSVSLI